MLKDEYDESNNNQYVLEVDIKCDKMIIACLKGNSSNDFYKHLRGKYIKDAIYKRLNLPENIYYLDLI